MPPPLLLKGPEIFERAVKTISGHSLIVSKNNGQEVDQKKRNSYIYIFKKNIGELMQISLIQTQDHLHTDQTRAKLTFT